MQCCKAASLFDDIICDGEQRRGHVEAERFGSLEIDDQLNWHGLLDRQVPLFPTQRRISRSRPPGANSGSGPNADIAETLMLLGPSPP
jgi:hypothetical protein